MNAIHPLVKLLMKNSYRDPAPGKACFTTCYNKLGRIAFFYCCFFIEIRHSSQHYFRYTFLSHCPFHHFFGTLRQKLSPRRQNIFQVQFLILSDYSSFNRRNTNVAFTAFLLDINPNPPSPAIFPVQYFFNNLISCSSCFTHLCGPHIISSSFSL